MFTAELSGKDFVIVRGEALKIQMLKSELYKAGIEVSTRSSQEFSLKIDEYCKISLADSKIAESQSLELTRISAQNSLSAHKSALTQIQGILNGEVELELMSAPILKPHQQLAAAAMSLEGLRGICLFDEQGVGKTLTAIAAFSELFKRGEISQCVIVAPKSLMLTWKDEFNSFFPVYRDQINLISGTKSQRFEAYQVNKSIQILTYESVTSDAPLIQAMCAREKTLLIVDESFAVKNMTAQRSQALATVRKSCSRAFVLCGTPAPNKPQDIVNQVNLADGGFTFSDFKGSKDAAKELIEIKELLQVNGPVIRRTKLEVLPELPEKNFEIISLPMLASQQSLYDELARALYLELRSIDNKLFRKYFTNYLAKRSALSQVAVDACLVDPLASGSNKTTALVKMCREILRAEDKKLVVWSHFSKSTDRLERELSEFGLVRVDGSISDISERRNRVKAFQEDDRIQVFLGNAAAAGAGLTLHAASEAIYVSWSLQAAHYMQSLDRIHRIGQTSDEVKFTFLCSSGTVEDRDLRILANKQNRQSEMLSDPDIWTLEDALGELSGYE